MHYLPRTWTALYIARDYLYMVSHWRPDCGVGWAEYGDGGNACCSREVSHARIIADIGITHCERGGQMPERRITLRITLLSPSSV